MTTLALTFEAALAIDTVLVPVPAEIATRLIPEEDPKVIVPVCAVAPTNINAATSPEIVVLPPDPDCNFKEALAVVEPRVTTFAASSLAIPTVFPAPTSEKFPVPTVTKIAPEEPPIVVAAVPEALINVVPTTVKAPNVVKPVTPRVPPIVTLPLNVSAPVTVIVPFTVKFVPTVKAAVV